jgi:hypothetical protein
LYDKSHSEKYFCRKASDFWFSIVSCRLSGLMWQRLIANYAVVGVITSNMLAVPHQPPELLVITPTTANGVNP